MKITSEYKYINQIELYRIIVNIDNTINYVYDNTIVNLINSLLKNNNKLIGYDKHNEFILEFFNEAEKVTSNEEPYLLEEQYNLLDKKFKNLDEYLGSL